MPEKKDYARKPEWLKIKLNTNESYKEIKKMMRKKHLHTVCEEAKCPNIHECWAQRKTATFMILGDVCTRACRFCAVKTGTPAGADWQEPGRVAESVEQMGLRHVVITSVARDDLADGGALMFAETIRAIRKKNPLCTIEVLPSDLGGSKENLQILLDAKPDIFNHNIETVPRLYPKVRPQADYGRSLKFLEKIKELNPAIYTKSGLMVGLGETKAEVIATLKDLKQVGCDIVTIGQYLQPSKEHLEVYEYIEPQVFEEYKAIGQDLGFKYVASAPYVRSSFNAKEFSELYMGQSS